MKKIIAYVLLVVIVVFLATVLIVRFLFPSERVSEQKRAAYCQFLKIQKNVLLDHGFWDGTYELENWFENIDLEKASCGYELLVIESKLFDMTGAEIVLGVSSSGEKYLQRIQGKIGDLISFPEGRDKFEFKEEYNPVNSTNNGGK